MVFLVALPALLVASFCCDGVAETTRPSDARSLLDYKSRVLSPMYHGAWSTLRTISVAKRSIRLLEWDRHTKQPYMRLSATDMG